MKRKRRLRKKLRLGEFQELGFVISFTFPDSQSQSFYDFFEGFIGEVEKRDLQCGGGGFEDDFVFLVSKGFGSYASPTEKDRTDIQQWLLQQNNLENLEVGGFIDANYDESLV